MRIRRAVASDFATAASISVSALAKDELYRYTNPYAGQEPSSFRDFLLRRVKLRNVLPGYVIWVAVTDDSEGLRDGLETILLKAQDSYVGLFQLDKSVSPSRTSELGALGFLTGEFADIAERWHLQNLVVSQHLMMAVSPSRRVALADASVAQVDPRYQRRGVGARLVSWGVEQAEVERVPITLTTSTVAEPLYRKSGFKTYKLTNMPGIRMGVPSLILWPADSQGENTGSRKE
ncbi:MAG: hypothetical protein Q9221_002059 [Calogaya cf. arnoldii]